MLHVTHRILILVAYGTLWIMGFVRIRAASCMDFDTSRKLLSSVLHAVKCPHPSTIIISSPHIGLGLFFYHYQCGRKHMFFFSSVHFIFMPHLSCSLRMPTSPCVIGSFSRACYQHPCVIKSFPTCHRRLVHNACIGTYHTLSRARLHFGPCCWSIFLNVYLKDFFFFILAKVGQWKE